MDFPDGIIIPLHEGVSETTNELREIERKLDALIEMLAPVGPALEQLPELMESVGPMIEQFSKSPIVKMLGLK